MKILGDPLFARTPNGTLKSRIGTMFFRTPGLVTQRGVHAMQRLAWIRELNRERAAEGKPELSEVEVADELANSADLIFTDDCVLIRPDPNRMDLAFRADEELQKMTSKLRIRFLNTSSVKVRDALRARGENWRMARPPETAEAIGQRIESSRCAIDHEAIYYYNRITGTRYVTAGAYSQLERLPAADFRDQLREIVDGVSARNRLGQPEVDFFPVGLSASLRPKLQALDFNASDDKLRAAADAIAFEYRSAIPAALRDESVANLDWRNEMAATLAKGLNETTVGDQDLIQGISPEFYRQIEWLPGGSVVDGRLCFDSIFDEAQRTQDPELLAICDWRVRSILFNLMRIFGSIEYANVGRIRHSLARDPISGERRGNVYLVQSRETGADDARVYVIRFQKWGIAEHLDEGKDLLQSIVEANEYADYIMDRRLACRQLGMQLPRHVGFGQFTEKYLGHNQYNGTTVRAYYYVRSYVQGTASDKIPDSRFRNPAFAVRFAEFMGAAAAIDLVVGRRATETGENVFDRIHEVFKFGPDGLPSSLVVTDHAGSFVDYQGRLEDGVVSYADVVRRREKLVPDYAAFAKAYVGAFERKLVETQRAYRERRVAFDELFVHRPYDTAGSGAYRWSCVLKRLDACDPSSVVEALKSAIRA